MPPNREPSRQEQRQDRDWDDRDRGDRDRDYDRESRRRDRDDYDRDPIDRGMNADEMGQLQGVSTGLVFVGVRYILWLCALILSSIAVTVPLMFDSIMRMRMRDVEVWIVLAVIAGIVSGLLALLSIIFGLIGAGMCCRAPARTGAKGLAMGSMICDAIFAFSIILVFLLAIIAAGMRRNGEFLGFLALAVTIIGSLCFITGQILMNLFLSRMAHHVQDPRLASSAITNLVLWLIFFVGGILGGVTTIIIMAAARAREETAATVALMLIWIFTLLMFLTYSMLAGICGRVRRRVQMEIREYR